ncbi:MAG: HD domain-containing protein [Burkholderiaceae bacterium]
MTPASGSRPERVDLTRLRWQILATTSAAAFAANVIGALFAANTDQFWIALPADRRFYEVRAWLSALPFAVTVALYGAYVAPLFRRGAALETFRRKVLGLPAFFLLTTAIGWAMGLLEQNVFPLVLAPEVPFYDPLLSTLGALGIAFASSTVGYFLLEYFNRTRWIPLLFDNRLEAYRGGRRVSIRRKFMMYYLGVAVAPVLFLGWVLLWTGLESPVFRPGQVAYVLAFVCFVLVLGMRTTAIVTRMFQGPLLDAQRATDRIRQGDFGVTLAVRSNDELGVLSERINDMSGALAAHARQIARLNHEIEQTQREVVFTMGAIGESRSRETGNHVKRVAEYSRVLALAAGLDALEADLLKQASPMHDIGKVAIPDAILNKPGRLTADEFEVMQGHARLGYEMLRHSDRALLKAAAIVALEHHEKWDGSGYPRGLAGEAIHIYGRITAVADVFDALGSDRVYKKAWPDARVFELIRSESGRHFDPRLVELFFANLDEILRIRQAHRDPVSEDAVPVPA